MKKSHAQAHNNSKTLISALLIGPNCGKMSVSDRPVWGQHQWVLEPVAFNVSVAVVTDKQLKQHSEEGRGISIAKQVQEEQGTLCPRLWL